MDVRAKARAVTTQILRDAASANGDALSAMWHRLYLMAGYGRDVAEAVDAIGKTRFGAEAWDVMKMLATARATIKLEAAE